MAEPTDSRAVKVGVLLTGQPDDLGEWLADAAAFEAAGVDALWIDLAPRLDLDPLALMAALAAVTYRSLLVTARPDRSTEALDRTLATLVRLSRNRLRVVDQRGAGVEPGPDPGERWVTAPSPDSRAAWRATLVDAAERGAHGVLVPAGPRLLDILRNPDDPGERRDLQLSQG